MFQAMFTMSNLHQASLPTVRTEFYTICQLDNESILKYTARVDIVVATMAKLGERISSGAWIYALGNGLRKEFKDSKDGILYNKDGYNTVMEVKTKLLSEEAVLLSQSKKAAASDPDRKTEDEIALASLKLKPAIKTPNTTPTKTMNDVLPEAQAEPKDNALWLKGKRGKGKTHPKGKHRQWDNPWTQSEDAEPYLNGPWPLPSPTGKGTEKGQNSMAPGKGFHPQTLWCDIHQRSGHSTDWCYENPHRTGGKAPFDSRWCETCNRPGHTANTCYATSIRISPKGQGNPPSPSGQDGKGKGKYGNRSWKSHNFPAAYEAYQPGAPAYQPGTPAYPPEQATPALHDETPSTKEWWETNELGSVVLDHVPPTRIPSALLNDEDDDQIADYIELILLAIVTNMERLHAYRAAPSVQL